MNPRQRRHIFRSTAVCDEDCWECRTYDRVLPMAFLMGVLGYLLYFITLAPPLDFPNATYVRVKEGQTLKEVGQTLKDKLLIRSVAIFEGLVRIFGSDKKIYAGEYFFAGKESGLRIAQRL